MTKKSGKKPGKRGKPRKTRGPTTIQQSSTEVSALDSPQSLLSVRRAAEKEMADLRRLVEERNFSSMEEANEFIAGILESNQGRLPEVEPRTDVERAQDIMYEAWGTRSGKKRAALAKHALDVSADCADAYVLLAAETAKTLREEADLFEQGVRAGERALGEPFFEEAAGHFWGLTETRPYMRARLGLAFALWGLGQRSAAIENAFEMLRLNPNDNQGVRDLLLEWLFTEGRDEEAGALLGSYDDDASATWSYGQALHAYRTEGKSAKSDERLREAVRENVHVPTHLLGEKEGARHAQQFIEVGGESEAAEYAGDFGGIWYFTPGALAWLREVRGEAGGEVRVGGRRRR